MKNRLKELEEKIFRGNLTNEEWLQLNKQVNEAWNEASEEERQDFLESGAGDIIGQVIEFMD